MEGGQTACNQLGLLAATSHDLVPVLRRCEIRISDHLRLCPNQELLRSIGLGEGPSRFHIFLGHAGWGAGQLESEISQGAWIPTSLNLELVFNTPVEQRWETSLSSEGLHPGHVGAFRPVN